MRRRGFASARPDRDADVASVLPGISTAAMDLSLAEPSRPLPHGSNAALVLDGTRRPHLAPAQPARRNKNIPASGG